MRVRRLGDNGLVLRILIVELKAVAISVLSPVAVAQHALDGHAVEVGAVMGPPGVAGARPARRPPRPGPVERHGDRSALAQAIGATAIGAASRSLNAAATAALVAAPKAARSARESFASTLGRGLADRHHLLALWADALRRLDRVDAVLIDPRALSVDELWVSRIRGAPEHDRAAIWE